MREVPLQGKAAATARVALGPTLIRTSIHCEYDFQWGIGALHSEIRLTAPMPWAEIVFMMNTYRDELLLLLLLLDWLFPRFAPLLLFLSLLLLLFGSLLLLLRRSSLPLLLLLLLFLSLLLLPPPPLQLPPPPPPLPPLRLLPPPLLERPPPPPSYFLTISLTPPRSLCPRERDLSRSRDLLPSWLLRPPFDARPSRPSLLLLLRVSHDLLRLPPPPCRGAPR